MRVAGDDKMKPLLCPNCKKPKVLKMSRLTGDYWCKNCKLRAYTFPEAMKVREKLYRE